MPDFIDFIPIFAETADTIRARVNADANAGLQPGEDGYWDLTAGGFFWDITQTFILESERQWDALSTEIIAAAFPAYAWGVYLDEHGITIDLPRKDASFAAGVVTFTGTPGGFIGTGTQVATQQTTPDESPLTFQTTAPGTIAGGGTVDVPIEAVIAGSAGNVVSGAISVLASPNPNVTAVTNATATTAGADIESDEAYRERLLLAFAGAHGAGTIADYQQWALEYPGVGHATVNPLWAGAGTVRVVITDAQNHPVPGSVVVGLQARLDPVAGEGRGLAPIGADVTVATPAAVTIATVGVVVFREGYSLDGASGTIAVRTSIETAIRDYINRLPPGDDVILTSVIGRIMSVDGVHDVSGVTLNGSPANVVLTDLQVAQAGTVTLT